VHGERRQPHGQAADEPLVLARATPSTIAHTSVDVPPMSKESAFSKPASAAILAAPTTPAAGPRAARTPRGPPPRRASPGRPTSA
jgi:hypothetical protein